jgi:hypothetical protein
MPLIGSWVNGYPLRPKTLAIDGRLQNIRIFPPRAFRNVAILFIFTLRRVIQQLIRLTLYKSNDFLYRKKP